MSDSTLSDSPPAPATSPADVLLSRRQHRAPPALRLWGDVTLALARVHEVCGTARRRLALHIAAQTSKGTGDAEAPVVWITANPRGPGLNACGMAPLINPGRVLFVTPQRVTEVLWAMEEALKSGAAPVVIADLPAPPEMTPVRRLHLAAEAGAATGLSRPLGLLLTPGGGGASGIESRWRCDPAHTSTVTAWRLERLRARMQPPRVWRLTEDMNGASSCDADPKALHLSPWPATTTPNAPAAPHKAPKATHKVESCPAQAPRP